ncbi:MAG: hypothetical protein DHS80DRAFT_23161 [Piptocephalis tieghemiana]|nr:MAG: hypothetical protein DHS80DRAFT_23161 [Piptocephalis tieghemiana]
MPGDDEGDYSSEAAYALQEDRVSSPSSPPPILSTTATTPAPSSFPIPPPASPAQSIRRYGSCPICLVDELKEPTFLDPCFHSYCYSCITRWLLHYPVCPLCKKTVRRLVYNVHGDRLVHRSTQDLGPPPIQPAPEARGVIYRRRLRGRYPEPVSGQPIPSSHWMLHEGRHRGRLLDFIQRELRLILTYDSEEEEDPVVMAAIMGLFIEHLGDEESMEDDHDSHRGSSGTSSLEISLSDWLGQEDAQCLLREVRAFAASGMSISTWDRLVQYEE